ncbi:MAG: ABC transporter permease [Halanaeroarchaeum sp.]
MSRAGRVRRIGTETRAALRTFLRRRTAVFFTFVFPVVLVVIFAGLVRTGGAGTGLFSRPSGYYVPGYLSVVVLFTPLSRVGSEVARHRDANRFEKFASTPLTRYEWLAAQSAVNVALILVASAAILALLSLFGTPVALSVWTAPFVVVGSVLFCGVGATIGAVASSQDGAISMSNGIALPTLFLSETFVAPEQFPAWFEPATLLSPLTYFTRGVRAAGYATPPAGLLPSMGPGGYLAILVALAIASVLVGGRTLTWTEP